MRSTHAASALERARNSEARRAETRLRAGAILERFKSSAERDKAAAQRDLEARVRDRTAELRDAASDEHERALGRTGGYAAKTRATAAEDRKRAAEDRQRAAEDRQRAAEDREHALAEVQLAQMDDLTGFYRPRLGRVVLQNEIDRVGRSGEQLVFLYFDVDGLKLINDTLGHDEGDRLLLAVAGAMRARLRSYDVVVRMGGDEFVVALSGIDVDQARGVASAIQDSLGRAYEGASVSFGLSEIEPGDSVGTMIKRGDDTLRTSRAAVRS